MLECWTPNQSPSFSVWNQWRLLYGFLKSTSNMKAPEIQWNPKVTPQAMFYLKTLLLRKTGFKKEHVFDLISKIVSLKVKMYNFQIFQCFKMPYMKSITLHIPYISKIFEMVLKPSNIKKGPPCLSNGSLMCFVCLCSYYETAITKFSEYSI